MPNRLATDATATAFTWNQAEAGREETMAQAIRVTAASDPCHHPPETEAAAAALAHDGSCEEGHLEAEEAEHEGDAVAEVVAESPL